MPTYEYLCTGCGHRFDVWQSINDDPLTTCDRCGERLRKVFHAAGIVFKGSGFYSTDSGRGRASRKQEEGGGDRKDGEARKRTGDKETRARTPGNTSGESSGKSADNEGKSRSEKGDGGG